MPQQGYYRFPSQSSGYDVELPDNRYIQGEQQPAQQSPQEMVAPMGGPAAPGTLADVEGLTDSYYDSWGKLQAYAKSMWLKNNVDVTAPDYSQPGGGLPFKTYQKLVANNMAVANKLGNQLKEQQQMRPLVATGQTIQNDDGSYTPTSLLPEVQEAFKIMDGPFYSQAEAERARTQIREQALAKLRSRPDVDSPYIQNNIRALEGAGTTWQTHPYFYQQHQDKTKAAADKAAAAASREVTFVKRIASLKNGYFGDNEHSVEERNGRMVGVSNALTGETINAKLSDGKPVRAIIKEIQTDPKGNTYLVFQPDAETGETPAPEQINNQDAADITARLQQFNPRFGNSQKMYGAIETLGLHDEGFGLNEDAVFGPEGGTLKERGKRLTTKLAIEAKVQDEKNKVTNTLNNLSRFSPDKYPITLPDGTKITIQKKTIGGNYYVDYVTDNKREEKSKEGVLKLLNDSGYFDQFRKNDSIKNTSTPPSLTNKISPEEFNSKWETLSPGDTLRGPDGKIYVK